MGIPQEAWLPPRVPIPVARQRCLHSEWQSPASESQPPWGSAHLSWWRFGWIAKEREGKSHLNPTNGALSGLFHNDFISQCEFSVEVTEAHPETPGTTFAGAYHLKNHFGSPALMQPSLLIEGFLLFHFFFLEKIHREKVCLPPGNSLWGGKLREIIFTCLRKAKHKAGLWSLLSEATQLSRTVHPQFTHILMTHFPLLVREAIRSIPLLYYDYRKWPQVKMCLIPMSCHTKRPAEWSPGVYLWDYRKHPLT